MSPWSWTSDNRGNHSMARQNGASFQVFRKLSPEVQQIGCQKSLESSFPLWKANWKHALVLFDSLYSDALATSVKERPAKRLKLNPSRGRKSLSAAGDTDQAGGHKRAKMTNSDAHSESIDNFYNISPASEPILKIMNKIEAILPRVGEKSSIVPQS